MGTKNVKRSKQIGAEDVEDLFSGGKRSLGKRIGIHRKAAFFSFFSAVNKLVEASYCCQWRIIQWAGSGVQGKEQGKGRGGGHREKPGVLSVRRSRVESSRVEPSRVIGEEADRATGEKPERGALDMECIWLSR